MAMNKVVVGEHVSNLGTDKVRDRLGEVNSLSLDRVGFRIPILSPIPPTKKSSSISSRRRCTDRVCGGREQQARHIMGQPTPINAHTHE